MVFSVCAVTPPAPCKAIMFSSPKAWAGLAAVVQQQMHEWDSSAPRPVQAGRTGPLRRTGSVVGWSRTFQPSKDSKKNVGGVQLHFIGNETH